MPTKIKGKRRMEAHIQSMRLLTTVPEPLFIVLAQLRQYRQILQRRGVAERLIA